MNAEDLRRKGVFLTWRDRETHELFSQIETLKRRRVNGIPKNGDLKQLSEYEEYLLKEGLKLIELRKTIFSFRYDLPYQRDEHLVTVDRQFRVVMARLHSLYHFQYQPDSDGTTGW